MEIHNDFQKNGDNAPKLVESKKKQPAITGPMKVLFLDDNVPCPSFFSAIHLFAKRFVANNMQNTFDTVLDIDNGKPTECVGSGGCYATYFSIPLCKSEQDIKKVVSAISDTDVIVCGRLSGNILGFNFSPNAELGPVADAIAERVYGGFGNVIRYNSEGDLSNYIECFEKLPPIVERNQLAYEKIFELAKEMQPKRNFIQNHEIESSIVLAILLGLGYQVFKDSEGPRQRISHSSGFKK